MLKEYDNMKEWKIWKPQQFIKDFNLFIKHFYLDVWSVEQIQNIKTQKLQGKKKEKVIFLLKCAVYDSKKLIFMKKQEASGLLSNIILKKNFK